MKAPKIVIKDIPWGYTIHLYMIPTSKPKKAYSLINWCKQNIGKDKFTYSAPENSSYVTFVFKEKSDLMFFKLSLATSK